MNVGSRMATVLWSPPSHRNGRLMEYRVFVVHADLLVSQLDVSRANVTVSNSTLTAGVSGLLPGTSYRVWVVAVNGMRSRELIGEFAMSTFTTNTEGTLDWCANAMYCIVTLNCCCFLSFFSST